ncbi:15371_t:CDS:2 [Cetraspora pellucida]|uniref:15371_t:CDS:1 n=1 Tax=Cetraspora pellucida TaxID=1433469 RepID=A0A9N9EMJ9_9GLOM|nr:15371_t:CDS:2 [Cetraspora pellucida]
MLGNYHVREMILLRKMIVRKINRGRGCQKNDCWENDRNP